MKKLLTGCGMRYRFTITEMMVVVAISMIILAMAMAAWVNSDGGVQLKRAARLVHQELNLARSKAIADRKPYRVRFYQEGDQQYCGIFDENDAVANETPLPMPGQSVVELIDNADDGYIEFDQQGRVSAKENVNSDSDGVYTVRLTSLLKDGEYDNDAYFLITVNPFNGRTQTTYYEVNN